MHSIEKQTPHYMTGGLLLLFIVWTALIQMVDVKAIGPKASTVGFLLGGIVPIIDNAFGDVRYANGHDAVWRTDEKSEDKKSSK